MPILWTRQLGIKQMRTVDCGPTVDWSSILQGVGGHINQIGDDRTTVAARPLHVSFAALTRLAAQLFGPSLLAACPAEQPGTRRR